MDSVYVEELEARCEQMEEAFDRLRKILVVFENQGTRIGFATAVEILHIKCIHGYLQNSDEWNRIELVQEKYKTIVKYQNRITGKVIKVIHWISNEIPLKQRPFIQKEQTMCCQEALFEIWNRVVGGNGKGASVSFIMDMIEAETLYTEKIRT